MMYCLEILSKADWNDVRYRAYRYALAMAETALKKTVAAVQSAARLLRFEDFFAAFMIAAN